MEFDPWMILTSDYVDTLSSHLAFKPIHAILYDMRRFGGDFAITTHRAPLGIATQAVQPICTTMENEATTFVI